MKKGYKKRHKTICKMGLKKGETKDVKNDAQMDENSN